MRRGRRVTAVVAGCALALAACGGPDEQRTADEQACEPAELVLAHLAPPETPTAWAAEELAAWAEQATDGRVRVELAHDGEGMEDPTPEGLVAAVHGPDDDEDDEEDGPPDEVDLAVLGPDGLVEVDQRLGVLARPTLVDDHDVGEALLDGPAGDLAADWVEEAGLAALAWPPEGMRQLVAPDRDVEADELVDGLAIADPGEPRLAGALEDLGAQVVDVDRRELDVAVSLGDVEALEAPLALVDRLGVVDDIGSVVVWDWVYAPGLVVAAPAALEALCAADRQAVADAAVVAEATARELHRQLDARLVDVLAEEGAEVVRLDAEAREALADALAPSLERWEADLGEEVVEPVDRALGR